MKNIIITCDTEVGELAGERKDAFEIFIKGEINGREVGAGLINKIADKFNAKVEHYVDVYPFERYGEAKFKKLCCDILDAGHGVNLHTHPSGKFDKNRKFMWQYSFEEQLQIIKFGKDKIYEWTGVQVISHRAGGYGANDDTLSALYQNEIFIDSSFFFKHQNCKISYPFINKSALYKGVRELPVSIYERWTSYYPLNLKKTSFQKLDFRYGSNVSEILKVIDGSGQDANIVLFLHSFNFLNLPYNLKTKRYAKISVNENLIAQFELLLSEISKRKECKFARISDIDVNLDQSDEAVKIAKKQSILKPLFAKVKDKFSDWRDI